MSDSKKDLTRIEDLGEYLHQLDDEKDYLPELPHESEPPSFMEETLISEDSFATEAEEETPSFESDLSEFSTEDSNFESSSFEQGENDFTTDQDSSFESSDSFDFSSESTFDSPSEFSNETNFSSDEFNTDNDNEAFTLSESDSSDEEVPNEDNLFSEEESSHIEEITETIEPPSETSIQLTELPPLDDDTPTIIEKTPLPSPVSATSSYQAPENFSDLKKFAENSNFSGMASEGNPSFSVLLKEIKYLEDAQDILVLLKELGLVMDSDEVLINRLSRGEFLIPRISEFAATILAHKIRRFDIDILVGLSDEIHPSKHAQDPEIGLVSKLSLHQNQAHHFQFDESNLDISQIIVSATSTLDGYQVIKYVGVASEHKMLEGHLVEDENSLEISTHYHELAQKLKAHALKSNANAVVGLNYQLTPLPSNYGTSSTRYRLTCTGNLVWINRV